MLHGYEVYDADAHAIMSPAMWQDLPEDFIRRRPRAVRIIDDKDLGRWNTGWLIEGRMEPHVFGPGSHAANTPGIVMEELGTRTNVDKAHGAIPIGCLDLSDPTERLAILDKLGIDVQFLMPSTLYANITEEPAYEAALYRTYNRYMGRQCETQSATTQVGRASADARYAPGLRSDRRDAKARRGGGNRLRHRRQPHAEPFELRTGLGRVCALGLAAVRAHGLELCRSRRAVREYPRFEHDQQSLARESRFRRPRRPWHARSPSGYENRFPGVWRRVDLLHGG